MKLSLLRIFPASVTFAILASSASAQTPARFTAGHGDIGVAFEAGQLISHWHIDGGTVDGIPRSDEEFSPGGLVAGLGDDATAIRQSSSPGRDWDPIGVAAGETFWRIPSVSTSNIPFLGFAAEEGFDPADWSGGIVFTLTGLTAPGGAFFSIYHFDPNSGDLVFDMASADGIDSADSFEIPAGAHAHFNLAFTQPGEYALTFLVSGLHQSLRNLSESATFGFLIVPESGTALLLVSGMAALSFRRGR